MPIIKSAIKKMKQDKKKSKSNLSYIESFKKLFKKNNKADSKKAYSVIDKAAKKGVIHKNKAARLKAKFIRSKSKK
jgi:small subunit ribosomal protein S20